MMLGLPPNAVPLPAVAFVSIGLFSNVLLAKLPGDGSLTGTYGSYEYAAITLTDAAGTFTDAAATLTDAAGNLTGATSSLTDSSSSLTSTTTDIE